MDEVLWLNVSFTSCKIILFIIAASFSYNAIATDTLTRTRTRSLSVDQTLISSNEVFELGFFSSGNSSKRYVGIWYKNIAWKRPIWVANRESPLRVKDNASVLAIGSDGNLLLLDGMENVIWSTNKSSTTNDTIIVLANNGDLILKDNTMGSNLWESFKEPCDTLIAGMKIGIEAGGNRLVLSSWKTEDDPSRGQFEMGFTTERPPQKFIWKNSEPYWRSGPWNGWNFAGIEGSSGGYSDGYTVTQDSKQGSVYFSYNPPDSSQIYIEHLTPEGSLDVSLYDVQNPEVAQTRFSDLVACDSYGACGPFGVCNRLKVTCECLKGFAPKFSDKWENGNWTNGCVRKTELACEKNSSYASPGEKNDGFGKLSTMKMPDHHMYLDSKDASGCREQCLNSCSCMAYAYVSGIGCLTWSGDLLDVKHFSSGGVDLFLRLANSELDEDKKRTDLIVILTTTIGVILFVGVILYWCYKRRERRRVMRRRQIGEINSPSFTSTSQDHDMEKQLIIQNKSSDLPMYSFDTAAAATNNFALQNKLGEGGFGPVYKGKLEDGREVAVKRLSTDSGQGIVEFKNEILLISKLQHRNLVKLLGYCIIGDEMLLIYEYMENKSLDSVLFDIESKKQLDWDKRFNIIQGIARGLLYLHRDSFLRIIHRDLKASNILLDDKMNPKISDFGLARGFQITQELGNTRRVVGTLGYISPEYAIGGLFSEKSDVFSFGVLLLEIISGEKNTSVHYQENYMNLLGYVWHLWEEGKGLELMDTQLHDSCPKEEFIKCLQIGLLCVQDQAIDRPTMSLVLLMLSGETPIPQPKKPTLYKRLVNSSIRSDSADNISKNMVSLSMIEGR